MKSDEPLVVTKWPKKQIMNEYVFLFLVLGLIKNLNYLSKNLLKNLNMFVLFPNFCFNKISIRLSVFF